MNTDAKSRETCKAEIETLSRFRERLPEIAEMIIKNCDDPDCYTHIDYDPISSKGDVKEIISKLKQILFPGFFSAEKLDPANLKYNLGQTVSTFFDLLSLQITHAIRHECLRHDLPCSECEDKGHKLALDFLEAVPDLRKQLASDVQATFDCDPAAKSYDEIIFSYPGLLAMTIYRAAHLLYQYRVPMLPRIMTEYAHSITGIDIHPGAEIGLSFAIDHGTGIVIGETTVIGKNVRIYQGVTLGALSLPKNAGQKFRGKKRHPTIEDEVIIYSGATILGSDAIIGARSIIGGNVWITESVPPDTKVVLETPQLKYINDSVKRP